MKKTIGENKQREDVFSILLFSLKTAILQLPYLNKD